MAEDPGIGYRIVAEVINAEGSCSAGHKAGDKMEISCHNPGKMCGWFYHDIFPDLCTFQFGGSLPWWNGDTIEVQCRDPYNLVTIKLERTKRE